MAMEPVPGGCSVPLDDAALHDLLGPANQIRIMLDLIQTRHRAELSDDARTLFDFLLSASDRLQCLMSGLRSYTHTLGRQQPFRRFDANAVLEDAITALQRTDSGRDAAITRDLLPEIWGDAAQIRCVFESLIQNSLIFRGECRPEIHVSAAVDDRECRFSVSDNGIGIDSAHAARIFGIFHRVHRDVYPGAGIGLAMARAIIERHGGRIWVESELGRGARFFFVLPPSPAGEENLERAVQER